MSTLIDNTISTSKVRESVDTVVIGAGVVGLAIARQLALAGREVLILEAEPMFGSGISARNSEVIHAGIYYETDSLKARLCVRGRQLLYDYCEKHHVRANRCGKLIVATDLDQLSTLASIQAKAEKNGVEDLTVLDSSSVAAIEPQLKVSGALLSPSTGIIDSHGFMLSLLGEAESCGAMIAYQAEVQELHATSSGLSLEVGGEEPMSLDAGLVVNAAGHGAIPLAISAGLPGELPKVVLAKGNYFALNGRSPVSQLVYPVPVVGGLGVHITIDLAGRARFGPDVEWVDDFSMEVDSERAESFYAAIRQYWPALPDDSLVADYAGIRPKISFGEQIHTDFVIQGPEDSGVPGLVNLFGIESPGLTASLAIAEYVATLSSQH